MNADSTRTRRRYSYWAGLAACCLAAMALLTAPNAFGQDAATQPAVEPATQPATTAPAPTTQPVEPPVETEPEEQQPSYLVGKFSVRYGAEHSAQPAMAQIANTPIALGRTDKGFVAPGKSGIKETIRLGAFSPAEPQSFSAGAIRRISEAIVEAFNCQGLVGVFVEPRVLGGSDDASVRPFVAGRLAWMRESIREGEQSRAATGLGGGLLGGVEISASDQVALEVAAGGYLLSFGDFYADGVQLSRSGGSGNAWALRVAINVTP